jgi:ADP-ribose pyrophosphatase YjhB (NUDIX family)
MTDLQAQALDTIDKWVTDPSPGLPEELFLFVSRFVPMINVDLLIKDESGRTLLTWRDDERYGAGWHVPGSIIRFQETAEARILAAARNELGTSVTFEPEPIAIEQFIIPGLRIRGHFISLLYACRLEGDPDEHIRYKGGTLKVGEWAWHSRCPDNMIADHVRYRRYLDPVE